MTYTEPQIWLIIIALGIGTYLIRFSFLGLIGDRDLPPWILRHLRYTSVAILPGLVAPLAVWPAANGGEVDPARLSAAIVTLATAYLFKGVVRAMLAGAGTLYLLTNILA